MNGVVKAFSDETAETETTTFTQQQNRAVLVAGLTCACFSVLATLVTLRWYILMKRTFRHRLVMFLILSDTFKALWYFLFPVVVFSRGPVASSSGFCQATGFFLAIGIEASDFAILMIALHAILYIFHPPARAGDSGGLYRWRKFVYPAWAALPILAASLAFVNKGASYTTAGTFCYLPRRPFWYRLALSWIPRYCILSLIILMYTALYIYVTLKFRSFSNLQDSDSSTTPHSNSRRSSRRSSEDGIAPDEPDRPAEISKASRFNRPGYSRASSYNKEHPQLPVDPWDQVSFITSKPLRDIPQWQPGIQAADFAWIARDTRQQGAVSPPRTRSSSHQPAAPPLASRGVSDCMTMDSRYTGDTITNSPGADVPAQEEATAANKRTAPRTVPPNSHQLTQARTKDPLRRTRKAIRKQLRHMFIYPAVYLLMWTIPFASHCLQYSDYYVKNPIFGLSIVAICMVSLQAGVDCIVFSWQEKPWRRIPEGHKFSMDGLRASFSGRDDQTPNSSKKTSVAVQPDLEPGMRTRTPKDPGSGASSRATSAHWWEAEGKRRKDSVWLGTDSSSAADRSSSPARQDTLTPSPLAESESDIALSVVHEHPHSDEEEGGGDFSEAHLRSPAGWR